MESTSKRIKRRYHAPRRIASATRTREMILFAAKATFESHGWSGATISLIAARARVSHQSVEALFGTKAGLLRAVVDFAIRGDARAVPLRGREVMAAIEAAESAGTMLDLHAALVRAISERSARIAWVVEQAAPSDPRVGRLWRRMTKNRGSGVAWAAQTLLAKPDANPSLDPAEVEEVFWVALDWGTYRTLTDHRGLTPEAFEAWLRRYYSRMLFA